MMVRININVADIRREPDTRSERVSQGLFNEVVEVIGDSDEMGRVRFSNGYEGWIGRQFIDKHASFEGQGWLFVQSYLAAAYEKPDSTSRRLTFIPYGCRLYGMLFSNYMKIDSQRYGTVFIHEVDLIDGSNIAPPASPESDDIVREAEKFLGTPYLWGGRSFFGIDCSGYVALIAERFGRSLPRDSKDQRNEGREIARDEVRRGDLLFFPGHVALAITNELYIHSSRKNGGVAYNSFDPASAIYSPSLDNSFAMARRIFE